MNVAGITVVAFGCDNDNVFSAGSSSPRNSSNICEFTAKSRMGSSLVTPAGGSTFALNFNNSTWLYRTARSIFSSWSMIKGERVKPAEREAEAALCTVAFLGKQAARGNNTISISRTISLLERRWWALSFTSCLLYTGTSVCVCVCVRFVPDLLQADGLLTMEKTIYCLYVLKVRRTLWYNALVWRFFNLNLYFVFF